MRRAIIFAVLLIGAPAFAATTTLSLGHSFITNDSVCLDMDGDGYGVGPGCIGPDADDTDVNISSAPAGIAKYGSLTAFIAHLGYTSSTYYCVSDSSGSDVTGSSSTTAESACSTPFKSWNGIRVKYGPGNILIFRSGIYKLQMFLGTGGTSTGPVVLMGYPGEQPQIDASNFNHNTAIRITDVRYIVIDGFKIYNVNSGAGIAGGTTTTSPGICGADDGDHIHIYHNDIRDGGVDSNIDGVCWLIDWDIEHNYLHDPDQFAGQHNVYLADHASLGSSDTIKQNIMSNTYTGGYGSIHINGTFTNVNVSQNILYNGQGDCIDFMDGVTSSTVEGNTCWNFVHEDFLLYNYDEYCGTPGVTGPCGRDQTGNVIANNTFWIGTQDPQNGSNIQASPAILVNNATDATGCSPLPAPCGDLGHNIYSNNNIIAYGSKAAGGSYPPVVFVPPIVSTYAAAYALTSTFSNNNFWDMDNAATGDVNVLGIGNGPSFGYAGYTCATVSTMTIMYGCQTGDPLFVRASTADWATPGVFNFNLKPASPSIHAGTTTWVAPVDMVGNQYYYKPSIGSLEFTPVHAIGWNDLGSNTQMAGKNPANAGVCESGACTNLNYAFRDNVQGILAPWTTAIYDAVYNRLIIMGGGHSNYYGDDSMGGYSVHFGSNSMVAEFQPAPFDYGGVDNSTNSLTGGQPNARHPYDCMVYDPVEGRYLAMGAGLSPNGTASNYYLWELNASSYNYTASSWTLLNVSGWPFTTAASGNGATCQYNPNDGKIYVWAYTGHFAWTFSRVSQSSYTATELNGGLSCSGTATHDEVSSAIIGSTWTFIGSDNQFSVGSSTHICTMDISGADPTYAMHEHYSSSNGTCDGWASSYEPGVAVDSGNIIGYGLNGGATVYVYNPQTFQCSTETYINYPSTGSSTEGMNRKWSQITCPNSGIGPCEIGYSYVSDYNHDAYLLLRAVDQSPPFVTIPSTIPAGTQNQAYALWMHADGYNASTWSVTSGSLPSGMSLASNGLLSGTPTNAGNFNFTVNAHNGAPPDGAQAMTLSINALASPVPTTIAYVSGNSQSGTVSSTLSSPFVAEVLDQFSNPYQGTTVTWAVTGGGGSLSGTNSISDSSGHVQTTLTLGNSPGVNTVTVSSNALSGSPITFTATGTLATNISNGIKGSLKWLGKVLFQ